MKIACQNCMFAVDQPRQRVVSWKVRIVECFKQPALLNAVAAILLLVGLSYFSSVYQNSPKSSSSDIDQRQSPAPSVNWPATTIENMTDSPTANHRTSPLAAESLETVIVRTAMTYLGFLSAFLYWGSKP